MNRFCMQKRLNTLATDVVAALLRARRTVCTAESCTGGWIAKAVTDIPGSSSVFELGFVTYSNAAKTSQLGVPEALLEAHGAVSKPVVIAMATGARGESGADISVAVSGIAGPDGGSVDKPVGTVWFAWSDSAGSDAEKQQFAGDRNTVRKLAAEHALLGVLQRV
jgi:nicotinamide-nucleotide amidase